MPKPPNQTRRQQIEHLVFRGWDFKRIAKHLGCTAENVRYYVSGPGKTVERHLACERCGRFITDLPIYLSGRFSALCLPCLRGTPNPTWAERLKAYRMAAGLSPADLAGRVGLPVRGIWSYESGDTTPQNWRHVALLAGVLGIGLLTEPPAKRSQCGAKREGSR